MALLMCYSPQPHHLVLLLLHRLIHFCNFLENGGTLLPTGLYLILSSPPYFHNFKQFSIKAATAYHPIIQKAVDELLAKGAIEPSSDGAAFHSNVFVVPKHTNGLWSILNLKQFNHYMHIPTFKMPTIRHVWELI